MANIHEVLESGPILASDAELELIVTGNGSYFNLWQGDGNGSYFNTDCTSIDDSMYDQTAADFWDAAKAALASWIAG